MGSNAIPASHGSPRDSGSRGSLNLESALIVALLVLVASFTLFSLGDAIRCLYAKEAAMASRIGFWGVVPEVTAAGADASSVAWIPEEGEHEYTVLRARLGTPGLDMERHETWDDLGTFASPPATGLDILPGDVIVVALDAQRCGYRLLGPQWPEAGTVPNAAWYAGSFVAADTPGDTATATRWVAAFEPDGTLSWILPAELQGEPSVPSQVGLSDENLFVTYRETVDTGSGPELAEPALYAYGGWKYPDTVGEPRLVLGSAVSDAAGGVWALDLDMFRVSSDGLGVLVPGTRYGDGARRLLLVSVETARAIDTGLPIGDGDTGTFGLDGNLYGMGADGGIWRLSSAGNVRVGDVPAGMQIGSVAPDGSIAFYDASLGSGSLSSAAGGTATPMPATAWASNASVDAATPEGLPVAIDGDGTASADSLRLLGGLPVRDRIVPRGSGRGASVLYLSFASVQGPNAGWTVTPPPPSDPAAFRYEILVNGVVAFFQDFTPADPDSVYLNDTVPGEERIRYGRDVGSGEVALPMIRATTHRIAAVSGYGRSNYAEINAPGGLPAAVSSMAVPWSNLGEIANPGGGTNYWGELTPDGESLSSGWAGSHVPLPGFWASSIEHGMGHAIAIGRDGSPLAKSLCISLTRSGENRAAELGGYPSRTYRMAAGATLAPAGEEDPDRILNIIYPMLPSGPGYLVPDSYGGTVMADMSLQVAGLSWDDGAGKIPDSMLTYFGSDAGYPAVAAGSRGLLVMDTNGNGTYDHSAGDTLLSAATRLKRSTVQVRVVTPEGRTVKPQVKSASFTPLTLSAEGPTLSFSGGTAPYSVVRGTSEGFTGGIPLETGLPAGGYTDSSQPVGISWYRVDDSGGLSAWISSSRGTMVTANLNTLLANGLHDTKNYRRYLVTEFRESTPNPAAAGIVKYDEGLQAYRYWVKFSFHSLPPGSVIQNVTYQSGYIQTKCPNPGYIRLTVARATVPVPTSGLWADLHRPGAAIWSSSFTDNNGLSSMPGFSVDLTAVAREMQANPSDNYGLVFYSPEAEASPGNLAHIRWDGLHSSALGSITYWRP